ncbi:MAG: LamG domain-containing protein [Verrucomicrobia bacterium]|nr:LamG domain-containing protein [Verrucomicrobiota bacterium]
MKNTIQRVLTLTPLTLMLLGASLQAQIAKNPDSNTLWAESGQSVQTVQPDGTDYWTDLGWQAGEMWLSGGLYPDITTGDQGGMRISASGERVFTAVKVPFSPDFPYLVWKVEDVVLGQGYHELTVGPASQKVTRLQVVGAIPEGTFIFNPYQQDPDWATGSVAVSMNVHNVALTIKDLRMVAEPENNLAITSPAFDEKKRLEPNDPLTITLTLAEPAASATVEFFDSYMLSPVSLNGQTSIALEAADASKKVWTATLVAKSLLMPNLKTGEMVKPNRLLFKATTADGGLTAPLWTGNPREISLGSGVQVLGAPKFSAGKHGQALSFDGVADGLLVPDLDMDDNEGTMECWIYLATTFNTTANIFRIDGADPWTYQILMIDGETRKLSYSVYNGTAGASVNSSLIGDGWHHVMATYSVSGGKIELFVDGNSEGTAPYTTPTTCRGKALGIGGVGQGKLVAPYAGLLDEIRISSVVRAPSGEETGPFVRDDKTVLLLHCDRDTGISDAAK